MPFSYNIDYMNVAFLRHCNMSKYLTLGVKIISNVFLSRSAT